jgi:hypothetical protein
VFVPLSATRTLAARLTSEKFTLLGLASDKFICTGLAGCAAGMKIVPPYPASAGSAVALGTVIGVNCPGSEATCWQVGGVPA